MLLQRAGTGTIPPSANGFTTPPWKILADAWNAAKTPASSTVTLGPATIELGHDDFEVDDASLDVKDHEVGWDNEHPRRRVVLGKFCIEWRPVTNGQFYEFWKEAGGKMPMPKSWVMDGDNIMVSTTFAPLLNCLRPIRLRRSALSMGQFQCRSPICGPSFLITIVFPLTLLSVVVVSPQSLNSDSSTTSSSAATKVDETSHSATGTLFREYTSRPRHLIRYSDVWRETRSATTGGEGGGRGHNGGVWEWTSTVFDKNEGFEKSTLYPGYSADFFDTHHNVVVRALTFGHYTSVSLLTASVQAWGFVCDDAPYCGTPLGSQLVPTQLSLRVCWRPRCVRCEGVKWLVGSENA